MKILQLDFIFAAPPSQSFIFWFHFPMNLVTFPCIFVCTRGRLTRRTWNLFLPVYFLFLRAIPPAACSHWPEQVFLEAAAGDALYFLLGLQSQLSSVSLRSTCTHCALSPLENQRAPGLFLWGQTAASTELQLYSNISPELINLTNPNVFVSSIQCESCLLMFYLKDTSLEMLYLHEDIARSSWKMKLKARLRDGHLILCTVKTVHLHPPYQNNYI